MSERNDMEMKRYYEDIELIDRFLTGQLSDEERKYVVTRLAMDAEFRELHDDLEVMIEGIRESGRKDSREEGEEIPFKPEAPDMEEGEIQSDGSVAVPLILVWWKRPLYKVAATVFVLMAVSMLIFQPFGSMSNDEFVDEYFAALAPSEAPTRSTVEDLRVSAYGAYEQENYKLAIEKFEQVIQQGSANIEDRFFLGISYVAADQYQDAIVQLEEVAATGDGYKVHAQWYLALSYVGIDEHDKAISILEEISSSEDYSDRASEVLEKIQDKN